jgi:hypothetical protein
MLNLAFIYITLIFLVLRFSVTVFNFLSNPKLGKYGRHFSDKVSVIIRMTSDNASLVNLLNALGKQDYQHIEVIIIQPLKLKSNAVVKTICTNDPRFQLIRKNSFSTTDATGEYLLFLEPDVLVYNGLINSLIYRTKIFNLALLNIIPTRSVSGIMNHILLPLNDFVLLNLIPLRLVRLFSSPVFSAGGSACMFFDTSAYRSHNWLQNVGQELPDAVEVLRTVKQEGFKAETLLGYKLIAVSGPEKTNGLFLKTGRQLLKAFGDNIFAASLYLLVVIAGPLVMLLNYEYGLLILPVGLIFLSRVMISFLSGQNPIWNILLHPVQMIFLFCSLISGIYTRIIRLIGQKS